MRNDLALVNNKPGKQGQRPTYIQQSALHLTMARVQPFSNMKL